ncbi:MAG: hypothetical protein VW683_10360 [Betaproteobacteria bacterium]|jgi:hypothetical protein
MDMYAGVYDGEYGLGIRITFARNDRRANEILEDLEDESSGPLRYISKIKDIEQVQHNLQHALEQIKYREKFYERV